ncbi:hypothetical protein [Paraburkholderia diazotrophica]|uniref:hypothetical protein n=1 Tax=Paraburkholderia diazotrophica TaxID=667676 RepID=UPI0015A6CA05|nr:hypothetical protein [Paraburkholderia diazotrophica]
MKDSLKVGYVLSGADLYLDIDHEVRQIRPSVDYGKKAAKLIERAVEISRCRPKGNRLRLFFTSIDDMGCGKARRLLRQ